jgi:hypothetical protein
VNSTVGATGLLWHPSPTPERAPLKFKEAPGHGVLRHEPAKTGKNTAISSAVNVEFVQVYLVKPDEKKQLTASSN